MYKIIVFVCCAIAFILNSTTEAKGGRGGGFRSSGRSSSFSGRGAFFSSSSNIKSSSGIAGFSSMSSSGTGKSSSIGGKSGSGFSGGWFHGFFHNTPYHYTYRPTHIVYGSSLNTDSYHKQIQEQEVKQEKETGDYAVSYSLSKAFSNDFFTIFNMVHDVSKYPQKIRNKELLTTTTQSPVATYDLNYIVNPPYTMTGTTYGVDSKSYFPDFYTPFDTVESKNDVENNDGIQEGVGNLEKVFKVTST